MTMNRQQRRALDKKQRKENKKIQKSGVATPTTPTTSSFNENVDPTEARFKAVASDLNKIYNQGRQLESKVNLLIETLERLGFISNEDIRQTEIMYIENRKRKQVVIKKLLEQDYSTREYLEAIKEDPTLSKYNKLEIDPVRDLNLNPYEIAQIVRDDNPDKNNEQLLLIGNSEYKLNKEHFGMK